MNEGHLTSLLVLSDNHQLTSLCCAPAPKPQHLLMLRRQNVELRTTCAIAIFHVQATVFIWDLNEQKQQTLYTSSSVDAGWIHVEDPHSWLMLSK